MNKMQFCSTLPAFGSTQRLLAATVLSATLGLSAQAADMYQPPSATPGGVQAQSQITGITTAGSNTTVCWYGMQGWYSVEMSTNNAPPWTSVGTTSASAFSNCLSVANGGNSNAFFRLNQNNAYVGSGGCAGCHGDKFAQESQTRHFSALDTLKKIGMDKNPSCLPCHTVGYGQPTGYTDSTNTSHLSDVGCENCHGPAAWHKYSDHDLIRPAVTIAAETCGGCHDGSHHPTYSEWTNSAHAFVTPDEASTFLPPNTGPARQMTCGPCHSGATRMAMLKNYQAQQQGRTNFLNLPSGHDAATYGPTCVVCHDPHSKAAYSVTNIVTTTNGMVTNIVVAPAQLRNPTFSKDYFTFFTTAATKVVVTTNFAGVVTRTTNFLNDSFTTQYDPSIQVCGQCHNSRGARWDGIGKTWNGTNFVNSTTPSWSRPPHHSPQYNVLVGIVQPDYLNTNSAGVATNYIARHGVGVSSSGAYNTNQCATCHVPSYSVSATTNVTGHTFAMDVKGCTISGCHGSVPNIEEFQTTQTNSLSRVVALLNQWATSKGPALFGANYSKYLANGWEFTTPGALASLTNAGPSTADQLKIPNAIKQARFNLYMVLHDASMGVHNPRYTPFLLSDADTKVSSQFTLANFKAFTLSGFAPLSVGFTNLGAGVTGYNWNFGDGNTSTLAAPTNIYASRGTYAVTLTATGASGSETLVRTNYITVSTRPVVSFTGTPQSGKSPLTVSFTNTSTSTNDVTAWRWTINGQRITTTDAVYTFTNNFTTNITFPISLRASTPAGTVTTTANAFITVTP